MIPVSAKTMRELDNMARKSGISTLSLMENAGEAVAKKALRFLQGSKGKRVAVFCGKGNNGGDGFVAARKLKESGFEVFVYLLGRQGEVKNEALINLRSFAGSGGNLTEVVSFADIERISKCLNCSLIIDAILGTGFSGSASGLLKRLIESLNSGKIPILAIDVPSGLNATTGKANPIAIIAKWTLSFALPKKGFYEKSGQEYAGLVEVTNIGFPDQLLKKAMDYERAHARH